MDLLQLVFLAFMQGFTEFLPISSSAHLILPSQLLGWPDQGLAFDVAVHVGSLLAVMTYFRQEVADITVGWLSSLRSGQQNQQSRMGWSIIVATIPGALAGLLLGGFIESNLRSVFVIASTTIFFGILLWFADRVSQKAHGHGELNWVAVIVIGLSQTLALIPGTSRSGVTMTAALFMGLNRELAARFSFLLSIPIILAAGGLKTVELVEQSQAVPWGDLLLGSAVSAATAYACIYLFLKHIDKIGFLPFVIYRLVLGIILFAIAVPA
jgi:undecaprenyl-diphosphatase